MTSLAIVGNADRETVIEVLALLKTVPNFRIIFCKQSNEEKLYIVTERVFKIINREGDLSG